MCWRATLLGAFGFLALHSGSSMLAQQTVRSIVVTTSSPSPDLVLISPQDPSFDGIAHTLLGAAAAGPALELKPFLVVLSNRSAGTVVAYEMFWKITNTDGTVTITSADFNYPDGVVAIPDRRPPESVSVDDRPLTSGEQRLIGREFQLDRFWAAPNVQSVLQQTIQDQQAQTPRIERLDINLDVAIFADGLAVGPDTRGLTERFAIYVAEKQRWIRQVVNDLDAGRSIDGAFQTINEVKAEPIPSGPNRDWSGFYRREAAAEISVLRNRIGDDALPTVFRKAVRTEPFIIRKSP